MDALEQKYMNVNVIGTKHSPVDLFRACGTGYEDPMVKICSSLACSSKLIVSTKVVGCHSNRTVVVHLGVPALSKQIMRKSSISQTINFRAV